MKKVLLVSALVISVAMAAVAVAASPDDPVITTLPSGLNYYNINFVTGFSDVTDGTIQVKVFKSGTSWITWGWVDGDEIVVVDNDATDGDDAVILLPKKYWEIYDQIRGKPTTSVTWFYSNLRGTAKPIWYAHFGPARGVGMNYNYRLYQGIWGGLIAGGWRTDYINDGCPNFATKWYYYDTYAIAE